MEAGFWHERWESGQLGFHQDAPDRILTAHWQDMELSPQTKVLVPLCGKSLDMLWLVEQGHSVVGIELSAKAVDEFFAENGLQRTSRQHGNLTVHQTAGIEIWCGDFFDVPSDAVAGVGAVYDRGSMVALPPDMRQRYTAHLQQLLPQAPIYLSCVEYDQSEMGGPPFSISAAEVDAHYAARYDIACIFNEARSEFPERFRQRGLTALSSKSYILRPR